MAETVAGLQVPISLGMSSLLGTAREPAIRLKDTTGSGWTDADELETEFRRILGMGPIDEG